MSNEAHFLNLPSHVINDILSRLPIKTVIRSKSVCKTWLNLLSESEFINLHLSRSRPCLIIQNLDVNPSDENRFNLVQFQDELADHHDIFYVSGNKIKPPKSCAENGLNLSVIGSINGLVCLNEFEHKHDVIYLWNPTIGESVTLQVPEGERSYPNTVSYGFGLSNETRQYKIVRIFQELEKITRKKLKSNCDVYTFGEEPGSWRRIGDAPFLYSCNKHGVFINGNLHWLIHDQEGPQLISCFDLEKEMFSPFPAPPEISRDFNLASLGVFGGCLSLCDNSPDDEIVIWVMKEYGITKIWSKEIVIDKETADLVGPSYDVVRVLKVFKDGDILLLWRDDILLSYDSEKRILHQSGAYKLIENLDDQVNEEGYVAERYPCIEATEFVSSFLSLKNFGFEIVERMN
ncbi:hypothetical protein ACH5RR_003760 [Cinchona calisaya]|uniref:F-box domain-containing protein n=1 Tax=Cinchona calisaya TaxID=153742 RepID=A0ABD3AVS1_9GENT